MRRYYAVVSEVDGSVVVWGLGSSEKRASRDAAGNLAPGMTMGDVRVVRSTRLAYVYADEHGAMVGESTPLYLDETGTLCMRCEGTNPASAGDRRSWDRAYARRGHA